MTGKADKGLCGIENEEKLTPQLLKVSTGATISTVSEPSATIINTFFVMLRF